jgi:hypothetical protein
MVISVNNDNKRHGHEASDRCSINLRIQDNKRHGHEASA